MASFLKKLSETAKSTVTVVSNKSADLVSTGKMKLEIRQLESKIKSKKLDIGELVYSAYTKEQQLNEETVANLCQEVAELELKISELESQQEAERATAGELEGTPNEADSGSNLGEASQFCPNCGTKLDLEAKFCTNCGNKLGE